MSQYKRKKIETSSSNPDARENVKSLTSARKRGTTLQSINGQLFREEKTDENSDKQCSEMKKYSKSSNDQSGDESDGDKSNGEEKSDESESEQLDEKEEECIESSPNYIKIISNDTFKLDSLECVWVL
ncbi:hypothetical protein H5410_062379 [Solanum commersonii]|uniref:Uncharacterized protein n=1 Tax=Solanum commersonii TaxID=4109 RepID=A0A9J5WAP4_SOLCO|nr:hypothetical protein H5410_062379 [Solanum commersonii]